MLDQILSASAVVAYPSGSIHIQPIEDFRRWLFNGNISRITSPRSDREILGELRCSGNI